MTTHELTTISFSHYNEKARWALDRFRVPFVEHGYLPLFHLVGVLRLAPRHGLGRADAHSTPFSTPVLVTDDRRCLRDSSDIVRYASDRFATPGVDDLYFDPEVADLEARFSNRLGPHARRFGYFHLFTDRDLMLRLAAANASAWQVRWFERLLPVAVPALRRALAVDEARTAHSETIVRSIVDEVSARVATSSFLVGDRLSAADIAFASLLAPVICVSRAEGYGATLPSLDECPPLYERLALDLRDTPAGRFALRLFREERQPPPVTGDASAALH